MCRIWHVLHSGENVFEVQHGSETFTVDEPNRTCTCRSWDICGIPCPHAVAAILYLHHNPDDYVSSMYKVPMFDATYSHRMFPVPGSNFWPKLDLIKPLPPKARRMPGRPTIKRKRDAYESNPSKVSSKGRVLRCQKCNTTGHNIRTCQTSGMRMLALVVVKEKEGVVVKEIKRNVLKHK